MSTHVKCWIALAVLMLLADLLVLILGGANTRFGLTGAVLIATGSLHLRLDQLDARSKPGLSEDQIEHILRTVAELPDRDSPEGWPEAMLVTQDELQEILEDVARGHA